MLFVIGLIIGVLLIIGFEFAYLQYLKYKKSKRKECKNK